MKRKIPSMTQIKALLRECAFDPRADGPLKIIADTTSVQYLELRTVEMLHEAIRDAEDNRLNPEERLQEYNTKVKQAIGLMALAKIRRNQE